jgi:hypothetical protein
MPPSYHAPENATVGGFGGPKLLLSCCFGCVAFCMSQFNAQLVLKMDMVCSSHVSYTLNG